MTSIPFDEIWLLDFEFGAPPGERPQPICLVAHEFRSGRTLRIWQDELLRLKRPPYDIGPGSLFVAYYASAEVGCHLELGWPCPFNILDLFAEFRNLTNGRRLPHGAGLLGALAHFGEQGIDTLEKEQMRQLALRGGPWTDDEQRDLLAYCESDVLALKKLLPRMLPFVDMKRALLRGKYMAAAARMEHRGTPIDRQALDLLKANWGPIQAQLIRGVDADYGVFDARTFKVARWEKWLAAHGIPWPRLASGHLALDDDTFRQQARIWPTVAPIRELRYALSKMRLADLAVGCDGRNRVLLSAFRATTGRNQPSNSGFIFGPAVWLRGLIRPRPGMGLAYVDWSQQEFGIAAALSADPAMVAAYQTGDPYLAFAVQAGVAPGGATKESHKKVREQFKQCALGVLYGMGEDALAIRAGCSSAEARELLSLHRRTYPRYWRWSQAAVDHAMLRGFLQATFGWTVRTGPDTKPRTLSNFPMQANGAEMLRLACIIAVESSVRVCAPVHDALLIEATLQGLPAAVAATQEAMAAASRAVLVNLELRSDVKLVRYPDRYMDERGIAMWTKVWTCIEALTGRRVP